MRTYADPAQLRNFGVIVGGIFGLIALWPTIFRGETARWWLIVVALALIVPALVAPRMLSRPYGAWMALGAALGWINTRIILGLIFFGIITPVGLVRRLVGGDPMQRAVDPNATSYRVPQRPRPGSHMRRQF